ncbi:YidC/Oxa1 family membrane protein insertase [Actinoplanes regularis]|uniref:Membrane protein insertase YidC n=1 Tax=Actinoplanes regularis TaxID=52697 RepID=A0A238V5G3_9ACTN|nr:membrane protein insertase YidC [Actinoplanes regularis]GIE83886.1 protein translocase component YidC [Actinoplanes regularis]GLW29783.1 protein translocase component YidC [Actinoplanes regularis]SNR29506.1 YidC/Oxa1 family membrane protein insertase [Actinoplanes regularis]
MSVSSLFHAVVSAAHTAITGLAEGLEPVAGGLAAALAIVVFTLLVRASLTPLTYLQIRTERRRAALAPELEKLRKKHRDPLELATATLALQREHGIGPFAGLLPALAQAPFFMVMYRVALDPPAGSIAGVPLTAHLGAGLPVFAVLLTLAAAIAWWSSRRAIALALPATAGPGAESQQRAAALTASMMKYLPWLTVLAVAWLPLAGGLYLVTSSAWTAGEQIVRRRLVPARTSD